MILVDTSIWVNYFRHGNAHLEKLLSNAEVICHPYIIGELACGNIKNRKEILSLLHALPMASTIDLVEYFYFIEHNKLYGRGIGFVDINLLASAMLSQIKLWTDDKRLMMAADKLGIKSNFLK